MYTFILVCSLSNLLLNEYDDDDDEKMAIRNQNNNLNLQIVW